MSIRLYGATTSTPPVRRVTLRHFVLMAIEHEVEGRPDREVRIRLARGTEVARDGQTDEATRRIDCKPRQASAAGSPRRPPRLAASRRSDREWDLRLAVGESAE